MTNLASLVAARTMDAACAGTFIESFGKRAFRRPLTAVEVERYQKVFAAGGDFANGIRLVVQTFLQSPKFLYLVETVPAEAAGKVFEVDGWAWPRACRTSSSTSMPDDALFAAAEAGQLKTPEQVGEQASRLMGDRASARRWPPSTTSGWRWTSCAAPRRTRWPSRPGRPS